MRITLTLDDDLLESARDLTGLKEPSALMNRALQVLIARERARRLAMLGGRAPEVEGPRRRRSSALSTR